MSRFIGIVSAYAYAVEQGYTGTEEEFATLMASYATVAEEAAESAESAQASATTASGAAQTATTKASEASASAQTATTKASEASTSATQAGASATSASQSASTATTKASEASASASTATTKASEAAQSASDAVTAKTAAQTAQTGAESSATTAQTAAQTATQKAAEAAESARTLTIDTTLTQSGQAADSKVVGDKIDELKEDLKSAITQIYDVEHSENICNPSTITIGSLKADGSVDATATLYSVSNFIEIKPSTTYTFTEFKQADGTASTSRKYCALYDENKTFVSGSYQNVSPSSGLTIQTGTAKYLRVASTKTNDKFVKEGSTLPSAFVAYEKELISKLKNPENSIGKNELAFYAVSTELINLYTGVGDVVGFITSTGNINASSTIYKTTAPIPIKSGIPYTISPRLRCYALYSDITADSSSKISVDDTEKREPYTFVSDVDGYLRVSYNESYPLTFVISTFTGTVAEKLEEGIALSNTQTKQVLAVSQATNILWGKKWAVCGDSFTHSGGTGTLIQDGKYKGMPYTYPWIIGNRQNMDIVRFFEGGRTLAFPAQPDDFKNSITCPTADWYYQNIPVDTDYITIYLGINDEHHAPNGSTGDDEDTTGEIPLGTITDATTATYYGAWNVVLSWLIENRPNAHIGIIVTNGIANNDNYRLAQIAIAKKYGIPYIDMNGDARTPAMLRTSNPDIDASVKQALIEKWSVNYPSNQHPNDAAQLFESTFIENFLRSI